MYNPGATYRIQFHQDFTLEDFEQVITYLKKLGIQTVYASPIFAAAPGSTHGYDGLDPHEINREIGTMEQFERIAVQLKDQGVGWLQDMVPNHMAFHPENHWLMDVLEKGKASLYSSYFDILWEKQERLMVPFLGASLKEVIERKELKIIEKGDQVFFDYYGSYYPLNSASRQTLEDYEHGLEQLNDDAKTLEYLAESQYYRLCHWQETDNHINYRRFFTVNGLICLNIQSEHVFDEYHKTIKKLLDTGLITGLRVDHIDGLYNPTGYLEALRKLAGDDTYIAVEKILEPGEALPAQWPIQGNTGYDFLALVNNLLTSNSAARTLTRFYKQFTDDRNPVHHQILEKKKHILQHHMMGELENLYQLFKKTLLQPGEPSDERLRDAIGAMLIHCPVYRFYGNVLPLEEQEELAVQSIFKNALDAEPDLADSLNIVQRALLVRPHIGDEVYNESALHWYQRCMQLTGPLMAKGVEDTLMYTYNRFIGHNDVGDAPDAFGMSKEIFHQHMLARQANWPCSLNATSTHDTKRGEDVRARLNVLTDLPDDWMAAVKKWKKMNAALKRGNMPDANDEYLIYQTLIGAHPLTIHEEEGFEQRLNEYLEKALREAKQHSDWSTPNEEYEHATLNFTKQLLDQSGPFWKAFSDFKNKIVDFGIINSLVQVMLKFTCPGVPDTYQGTELWDLSFVDPDNRRPVDYVLRNQYLEQFYNLNDGKNPLPDLWTNRTDARIKHWLTFKLLQLRKDQKDLFANGTYVPLRTTGKYKDHVFAFARRHEHAWIVVALPLNMAGICKKQKVGPLKIDWKDTTIVMRPEAPAAWNNLLAEAGGEQNGTMPVQELFMEFPLALLELKHPKSERDAGILMSITSLPSLFGIGDFGPAAMDFARFLSRANQSIWQLLPVNPISAGSAYSPYSSISTMAGNTLLISPELLAEEGLLDGAILPQYQLQQKDQVDYETAINNKRLLLDDAYQTYKDGTFPKLAKLFEQFKKEERYWLEDFALFVILKEKNDQKPWYEWADPVKERDSETIAGLMTQYAAAIEHVQWLQFIFSHQWNALRKYCNRLGIQLLGDLPFYASYDSADVWTNRSLFSVDDAGQMTGIAGVPPDYFSETGQLWGMPTFNWDAMKAENYQWWINRLRKNLELYDLLRIDHFRALSCYWEVPAGEETAVNGKWIEGPGTGFFKAVKEALGSLPFIAEDLGDEMDEVYKLRNEVGLPGMKVLQFAFNEQLPGSVDIPHNFGKNCIAYTGTHDNNTTLGWYRMEVNEADRKRLEKYLGYKVNERNICEALIKLAYSSVARMAIIPLQDVLSLDERARMNVPSSSGTNWGWRLLPMQLNSKTEDWLRAQVRFYNRI